MKKLFGRLSVSGKIEADTLREDKDYSDEEQVDQHYRKSTALPSDVKDTSQDLKMKKSFSSSGSIGRNNKEFNDFTKQKSSSSGIKKQEKEIKEKDKLHNSSDKALKKSPSRKKSISKSSEVKDEMKSPALRSVYMSAHEQRGGSVDSDESDDDMISHKHKDSQDDDFYTTTPIRVPSAPACLASSPLFLPARSASPYAHIASPRKDSPPAFTASPPQKVYSPQAQYGMTSSPHAQVLPRSVSSPNPAAMRSPEVIAAEDFDLRFGGADAGHARTDSNSDNYKTALGSDFAPRGRVESVPDEEEVKEEEEDDGEEITNQKVKSGRFKFGNNKSKKLK